MKAEYEEKMLKAEDVKAEEYYPRKEKTDESRRPFFHKNSVTNNSVREKSDVMKSEGELMLSKCGWKEYKTKNSGKMNQSGSQMVQIMFPINLKFSRKQNPNQLLCLSSRPQSRAVS